MSELVEQIAKLETKANQLKDSVSRQIKSMQLDWLIQLTQTKWNQ